MKRKFLSTKQVVQATSLSRSTLWRKVQAGEFPKPISISIGRVAYIADEVEAWVNKISGERLEVRV